MFDLATFQTAVSNFLLAAGWALEFTNGDDTYTFNTDSGPKKSFAKAIKDFDDAGAAAIAEFEAMLADIPQFATLAEANAAEPHNVLFYNTTLNRFQMTV